MENSNKQGYLMKNRSHIGLIRGKIDHKNKEFESKVSSI